MPWLLHSPKESNGGLPLTEVLGVASSTADGVLYGLQDLDVVPAVAPLTHGFWTAAEDEFQGPPLFRHRLQAGDITNPQLKRLDGIGGTLQTAWISNHK